MMKPMKERAGRTALRSISIQAAALILALTATELATAAPVSREEAQQKALRFMQQRGRHVSLRAVEPVAAPQRLGSAAEAPAVAEEHRFHVFNVEAQGGFVIVSGDDRCDAVLGYADSGEFSFADMPDNLRWWLASYDEQLAALARMPEGDHAQAASSFSGEPIAPLVQTKWDQGAPYNDLCPLYNGQRCVTGCVATAMAQIMYYHRHPAEACEGIPGYEATLYADIGELDSIPPTTFDWDNMQLTYDGSESDVQREAVARLMQYCGWGVHMAYSPYASGATSSKVGVALATYFDYGTDHMKDCERQCYSSAEWDALIYGELAARRPVYYGAGSSDSRHAFVCDGYDGNGLFHINWGWGGSADGYFVNGILNGYNRDLEAIVGIQPSWADKETPYDGMYLDAEELECNKTSDNDIELRATIYGRYYRDAEFYLGLGILDDDGTITPLCTKRTNVGGISFHMYGEVPGIYQKISSLGLSPGTYRIVPFSHSVDVDTPRRASAEFAFWEVTISDEGNTAVAYPNAQALSITDYSLPAVCFAGQRCNWQATITAAQDCAFPLKWYYRRQGESEWHSEGYYLNAYFEEGKSKHFIFYFTPPEAGFYEVSVMAGRWNTGEQIGDPIAIEVKDMPKNEIELEREYPVIARMEGTTLTMSVTVINPGENAYTEGFLIKGGVDYSDDWVFDPEVELFIPDTIPAQGKATVSISIDSVMTLPKLLKFRLDYFHRNYGLRCLCGPSGGYMHISADDKNRFYGEANPEWTWNANGYEWSINSLELSCEATPSSPVGTYDIVIEGDIMEEIWILMLTNGTLTVEPAPLTVTAQSYTVTQGDPMPDFAAIYDGWKLDEDESVLTARPTLTPEVQTTDVPGTYTIAVGGAEAQNYAFSYVAGTLTVKAKTYTLTYLVDGEIYSTEALEHGATITPIAAPQREGYTFSGWIGLPETMPDHDVTVEGTFAVNSYTLTYLVDGETYRTETLEYGATVTPIEEPEREGYTFSGWSEVPETMPAHDVTVEGSFVVNDYTLTYLVDGETYRTETLEYGTTITPADEPEREGYTFSGWSEIPATMPAHDVTVEGSFAVNDYTLTWMVNSKPYLTETLEYGATIVEPEAPVLEGYDFDGWMDVPATMPAHDLTIYSSYTLGIEDLIADGGRVDIYTASGLKLYGNVRPEDVLRTLPAGIYIVGGRKVMKR